MAQTQDNSNDGKREPESLKETLISIIIAFALAFVGRSYVIEPFVIPTGSMAPTLNGAHMRFHSPASGFEWAANPRDYTGDGRPYSVQGARRSGEPITVTGPLSHIEQSEFDVPLRAGDRILVISASAHFLVSAIADLVGSRATPRRRSHGRVPLLRPTTAPTQAAPHVALAHVMVRRGPPVRTVI